MISKIKKGSSFKGVLAYVAGETAKDQHAVLLFQNVALAGHTTQDLNQAFKNHAELGNTSKPVLHMMLSPTSNDWKKLKDNPELCVAIVDEYMERMGFGANHPRVVFQHNEKDGTGHFHIVSTNVLNNHKIWKDGNSFKRSMEACRSIESLVGLDAVSSQPAQKLQGTKNEIERYKRTGGISPFEHIQNTIDGILQNGLISQTDFAAQLKEANIGIKFNQGKNGLNGASFLYAGIAYKGSKFGKNYTGKGLESRGLCTDEAFAIFKDDFKAIGHPVFESTQSRTLKATAPEPNQRANDPKLKVDEIRHKPTPYDLNLEPTRRGIEEKPTPKPSHKPTVPKPEPPKNRSIDAEVQKVIQEIALEFFGTGKDKQPTLDKQAEQALSKAGGKHSAEHIKKAIKKISQTHQVQAKALEKAHERIEQKRGKDATPQPYFGTPLPSSGFEVPKLTPETFKNKKEERDRDMSYNDDGSIYKAYDQMTEHEKNQWHLRKNTSTPTYKPTLGKW